MQFGPYLQKGQALDGLNTRRPVAGVTLDIMVGPVSGDPFLNISVGNGTYHTATDNNGYAYINLPNGYRNFTYYCRATYPTSSVLSCWDPNNSGTPYADIQTYSF